MVTKDANVMNKFRDTRWILGSGCPEAHTRNHSRNPNSNYCTLEIMFPDFCAIPLCPGANALIINTKRKSPSKGSVLYSEGKMLWYALDIFVALEHPQDRLVVVYHCERFIAARKGP